MNRHLYVITYMVSLLLYFIYMKAIEWREQSVGGGGGSSRNIHTLEANEKLLKSKIYDNGIHCLFYHSTQLNLNHRFHHFVYQYYFEAMILSRGESYVK